MKRFITIALLAIVSQTAAANCFTVADGFTIVADMGRRGVPVSEVTAYLSDGQEEYSDESIAGTRAVFLEAYQSGANGASMKDVWVHYYDLCKGSVERQATVPGKESRF